MCVDMSMSRCFGICTTGVCLRVCVCVCAYVRACGRACVRACVHSYARACVHACARVRVPVHLRACTCPCPCAHVCVDFEVCHRQDICTACTHGLARSLFVKKNSRTPRGSRVCEPTMALPLCRSTACCANTSFVPMLLLCWDCLCADTSV